MTMLYARSVYPRRAPAAALQNFATAGLFQALHPEAPLPVLQRDIDGERLPLHRMVQTGKGSLG